MLIVLTGLQPTLWFADVCGGDRKFLFARVVHDGKLVICAMCVITRTEIPDGWLSSPLVTGFRVRELGLGLTPVESYRRIDPQTTFTTMQDAKVYATQRARQILSRRQSRELILHVAGMYDATHYKNWEVVCLL